jgi:hypothetical protein
VLFNKITLQYNVKYSCTLNATYMASINFETVFETLKQGVANLAQTTQANYVSQAESDGQNILNQLRADLQTWTTQFLNNEITADDLRYLIESQKDLLELTALTQAGIADVILDNFKDNVLNLITNAILDLAPNRLGGGGWGDEDNEGNGDGEEEESGGGGSG